MTVHHFISESTSNGHKSSVVLLGIEGFVVNISCHDIGLLYSYMYAKYKSKSKVVY